MGEEHLILHADVAARTGILPNRAILIRGDRIERILPAEPGGAIRAGFGGRVHDGSGMLVCAGFIDVHSDSLESAVQPRPTSVMDSEMAFMEHEKTLVNQGITTMYHSLSFMGENGTLRDKEARKPRRMRELAELIAGVNARPRLIRHRFHYRFDVRNVEGYDTLLQFLDRGYINLLSFIDHTPGQGQYRDIERYKANLRSYRPGIREDEMEGWVREKIAAPRLSDGLLESCAAMAKDKGVPIASHDDDSTEKLDYVRGRLRSDISEFPVELGIALEARKRGMHTVAGAPNVLMGKSHSGNLSAVEAVLAKGIDILCSDYFPPALLHAVFKLNREYYIPLCECLNMVSANPARALGIEKDYGAVEEGKKADILLIKVLTGKPLLKKVFVDGVPISELNYRGQEMSGRAR